MLIPSFHPGFRNNHSQASCESLESSYLHPWMLLGRGAPIQLKFLLERLEKPLNFYPHGFLKVWNVRCPEILGMWLPQQPRSGMGAGKLERNIPSWKRTGCGPREILECWWEWERWERGDCSSHLQENWEGWLKNGDIPGKQLGKQRDTGLTSGLGFVAPNLNIPGRNSWAGLIPDV